MILYVLDAALIGGAGFLFLRGIHHGGAIARMAFDGLRPPPRRTLADALREERDRNCVDCQDAGHCLHNRRCQVPRFDHDAHELALFRDTGAWRLDPNRWGDAPVVVTANTLTPRSRHCEVDREHGVWWGEGPCPVCSPKQIAPACPHCASPAMTVMAEHGGHVSLWGCTSCSREWVPVGRTGFTESKLSRRRREKRERIAVSQAAHEARALEELRLPCGCTGEVWTRAYPTGGWDMGRYAECVSCKGTWDYARKGGDTGNPRKKVRGEVEWPNGNPMLPEQLQRPPGGLR